MHAGHRTDFAWIASNHKSQSTRMSVFFGREYNYAEWARSIDEMAYFKTLAHAGDAAPHFTLPSVGGPSVTLAALRGAPVVLEFGSLMCPPCEAGFPVLDALAREFDGAGPISLHLRARSPPGSRCGV